MWNSIKRFFGGRPDPEKGPEIPWIPADRNPWGVPVLDLRPVTTTMLSTSSDVTCAQNAVSFSQDDGTSFIGRVPDVRRTIPAALRFRRDRLLADGALFLPQVMEHKWAIYHHVGKILFIRSWTRTVVARADIRQNGDALHVVALEGSFLGDGGGPPEQDLRVLEYLLRTHAVGLPYPAPLFDGLEQDPQAAALVCFSLFGNMAHFATPHEILQKGPDVPLRSHSLLHIAVARDDRDAAERQLSLGVPVDLLAGDGLPPLHWALARDGTDMLQFLVEKGSALDVRSAEGATPLMSAAQGRASRHARWLLAHGADPNARDSRGFTALHRAAEMGFEDLVDLLLTAGADPLADAEGHTPLSLAEARGHAEIASTLRNRRV